MELGALSGLSSLANEIADTKEEGLDRQAELSSSAYDFGECQEESDKLFLLKSWLTLEKQQLRWTWTQYFV